MLNTHIMVVGRFLKVNQSLDLVKSVLDTLNIGWLPVVLDRILSEVWGLSLLEKYIFYWFG